MTGKVPAVPHKADLLVHFVIIGGGVAGLAAGIALTRVGHQVTVLEKSDGRSNRGGYGLRVPPNMSKIFFHWGLKERLLDITSVSRSLIFSRFEGVDILGTQTWNHELIEATRGEFLLTTHADLHQLLSESAVEHGVDIRYDSEMVAIDLERGELTLASGAIVPADVFVGADGETGVSRGVVVGQRDRGTPVGMSVISVNSDAAIVMQDLPEHIRKVVKLEDNMIFAAFGNGSGVVAFPVHRQRELAFHFLLRDSAAEGTWGDPPCTEMKELVPDPCDPRVRQVANNARDPVRVVIKEYTPLESWVHASARLVLIGQAAHAFPAIAVQGHAMAVEDAAVLGKLFGYLSSREQIPTFLYAFQDIRERRCTTIQQVELGNIWFMTLADSPEQRARDDLMRAKSLEGKNALSGDAGEEDEPQWREVAETFAYDCEDEADNWWHQWGVLRERAKGDEGSQARDVTFKWSDIGVVTVTESS